MRMTLPGTILPPSTTGTSLMAPTARIAASGGLMIAVNSSTPNMPRLEMENVAPVRSPSAGRPERARSMTCRDSIEIWTRSFMSASCTTGTSRPMPWLGATARPMLMECLRWNLPSAHDELTSGNLRSASAQARTRKSVIVTFSAPGTESLSCWRRLTARSTRASTVTWNSGTVDFDSAMRRAMVACMRLGSMTSTSGPAGLSAGGWGRRRSVLGRELPAAITSSFTMRPSGPVPFRDARSTPISSASSGALVADSRDGRADLGRNALLDQDLEHAVRLSLEVEGRFVRLDLGQHLASLHLLAALLLPLDDRALFHRVGQLGHVDIRHPAY